MKLIFYIMILLFYLSHSLSLLSQRPAIEPILNANDSIEIFSHFKKYISCSDCQGKYLELLLEKANDVPKILDLNRILTQQNEKMDSVYPFFLYDSESELYNNSIFAVDFINSVKFKTLELCIELDKVRYKGNKKNFQPSLKNESYNALINLGHDADGYFTNNYFFKERLDQYSKFLNTIKK